MARWFGYRLEEIGRMRLNEVWLLDRFLSRYPPADLFVAAWFKYQPPAEKGAKRKSVDRRTAIRENSEVLAKLPIRKNAPRLENMPAFVRTPEMIELVGKMRREWQETTNSA